jgi:hypothetical protein
MTRGRPALLRPAAASDQLAQAESRQARVPTCRLRKLAGVSEVEFLGR